MLETTNLFAETTDSSDLDDCLSDALRTMKVSGSVLLHETYAPPWAVSVPTGDRLRALLSLGTGICVVPFHCVTRGQVEITLNDSTTVTLGTGDLAICFGGAAHRISNGASVKTSVAPVESLLRGQNVFRPRDKNLAHTTELICGAFYMHDTHLNPMFAALPSLLHMPGAHINEHNSRQAVTRMLAFESSKRSLGGNYIIERLLELLCAEAIRAHLASGEPLDRGWFRGLKDPTVGRAIALIHARPGENWSVIRLAENVAMSPSRFAARFSGAVGESPMAYLAKWRMNVASRLLNETQRGINDIATNVGYENVAAFSRAFKRHVGTPPATWRARSEPEGCIPALINNDEDASCESNGFYAV